MHGAWRSRGAAVAQPSVAAMELAGRAESIEAILASPVSLEQEELLARAVADFPRLRIRASLRLARILALPERGASRAEILDFEVMLWPLRSEFSEDPIASWDLAEVCRALNLEKMADVICSRLSEATQKDFPDAMWSVMVDLATWHAGRGEQAEASRLWELARLAPKKDHRLVSRFYSWRFDHEPGPPDDLCLCAFRASPPIMRPLLGPERHCPCCLGPADRKAYDPLLLPGPDEAVEKLAFEEQVRKVLGARYNLEGSFALAGDGKSEMQMATKEAKEIVWGRRFKVRIVDPKSSDGVAAEAQHRQKRAEESRLKARGLATGSEFSSTQSSGEASESSAQAESSDDDSDLYFCKEDFEPFSEIGSPVASP